MKLDLGLARLEVPNSDRLIPTMVIGIGREDTQEKLAVGPTLAKAPAHSFQRTLSVNFVQMKDDDTPEKAIEMVFNETVKKVSAKVRSSEQRKIGEAPALVAELSHLGPKKVPLVTFMLAIVQQRFLQTFLLIALDDKKTLKEVRAQFDMIAKTIQPGSFFEK